MQGAMHTDPYAIDGDNVVGFYHDGFRYHGFVYVIPEPATLLLFGLGVVMLRTRR